MAKGGFSLDDYVDVAERIQDFMDAHEDGSLQTVDWGVIEVGGKPFVWYRAAAYRSPDDERPGHGIAWEPFPGPTSYTKDSELMNAETAAWGRAIVALGLAANRKIASRQEVRARTEAAEPKPSSSAKGATPPKAQTPAAKPPQKADDGSQTVSAEKLQELRDLRALAGVDAKTFRWLLVNVGVENAGDGDLRNLVKALTPEQADKLAAELGKLVQEKSEEKS